MTPNKPSIRRSVLAVLVLVCTALSAQEREPGNLNLYYRYPLAVAADLHNWNSFRDYGGPFSIFEFGGSVRYPLPAQPVLQPLLRGSFVRFDSLDEGNPTQWDHTHVFAGVGIAAVNRLARNFEIGAELVAGFSRTRFPNLTTEPVGYNNLLAVVTPRLTLLPSFNFAINVEPTVRYSTSLGPVDRFNGLSFSIGIGAEYRLGQDPDSPGAEIRSLQISQPEVDSVFAAMQSYYVNNPIGTVTIENVESFAVEDVRLSFFQNGYMDSPTPAKRIDLLEPGERRDVDLFASYNGQVFTTEGVQPLVGEVIISYLSRGRPAEQRESVVYDLHDKTALTWDDNSKMGSFITPADSAIRNYTSFVTLAGKDAVIDSASGPLQTAMLAYHALVELGVVYQVDPTAPFTQVQSDIRLVDSVSIPRDTLARLTGDCDDLTALYATMLETVGIETGFITTPGHIYVVFNTRVPARDYLVVHPDRDMFFVIEDEIWVPVEITMLGRGDFMDAWRFGADEWAKYENQIDQREMVLTRNAQTVYRSVGLREADLGLQYGSPSRIVSGFRADFDDLTDTILASVRNLARQRANKRAYNTLGIYAARLGRYDEARTAFDQASRMDSSYIDPRINLGALYYLQENYWSALRAFQTAVDAVQLSRNPEPSLVSLVYINLSKTQYALGNFDQAEEAYEFAARADPGGVAEFEYLASAGTEGARASEAASGPQILFADVSPEED